MQNDFPTIPLALFLEIFDGKSEPVSQRQGAYSSQFQRRFEELASECRAA